MFDAIATARCRPEPVPPQPAAVPTPHPPHALFEAIRAPTRGAPPERSGGEDGAPVAPRSLFASVAPAGARPATLEASSPESAAPAARPPPPLFDREVERHLGASAVRRCLWTFGAGAVQAVLATLVLTASTHVRVRPVEGAVEVRIVAPRAARPGLRGVPPPPPPLAARRTGGPARARPATARPLPPAALVQPREVALEMKLPAPGDAEDGAFDGEYEGGVEGGVVGGVPGGVIGGVLGAEAFAEEARSLPVDVIEDAPQYATAGYRKPAEREPGCFRRSMRLPKDLAGYVSGPMTVRFAVLRDGTIGAIELLTGIPDARIREAIVQALRACPWVAGADPRGVPVALWVVMPIRFESG